MMKTLGKRQGGKKGKAWEGVNASLSSWETGMGYDWLCNVSELLRVSKEW